ncbi:LITTLE ZIPPER 3 [Olea europaea subsp. europaea]|uniref:LITTLE ZIPPER 3 n=1 Tax=Olea europaea subsp. europaea TaxID=158383 RepID=A0A8S0RXZ3_OLEEU|nr:LITTLE ZIPPER 3 [Olea europaea subsp. europaea]CAA2984861.1 LITTLE ZIPPER 3 [Olea europaea subsp. europaea]
MEQENSRLYLENCYLMKLNKELKKLTKLLKEENEAFLNELNRRRAAAAAASRGLNSPADHKIPSNSSSTS